MLYISYASNSPGKSSPIKKLPILILPKILIRTVSEWHTRSLIFIHHPSVTSHAFPNEDIVAVNFQKGWNKVLEKIDQLGLRWGLFFSVSDPERILTFNSKH